ncbi:MAG: STY0301 family protein [Duganella sp.]
MWDFSDIPDDEKWLSCGYGKGGELTLSRPLPRAVSRCVVTVATLGHGWVDGVVVRCERAK